MQRLLTRLEDFRLLPIFVVASMGIGIAIAVPVLIGRLESRADRQRREALQAQSAVSADLLAA